MPAPFKLEGQRFGRLVVIERAGSASGSTRWKAICDCGSVHFALGPSLTTGHTKSCGCWKSLHATTHGASYTSEFNAWRNIIQRCTNPNAVNFKHYGGRGISICDEWKNSFEAFLAHVGKKPTPKHTIDRFPNNNGNYEPGNVRWATYSEQNYNRRNNGLLGYRKEGAKNAHRNSI